MTYHILAILGSVALPATAFAHPGHIADAGQGHSHWFIYVLLGCALFGIAAWVRTAMAVHTSSEKRH